MQLKIVVLPAPLGPMSPTISNSPTLTLTSRSAWRPPKRMLTSRVSRTGIDALRARPRSHVKTEASALEPSPDRCGDRSEPLRLEDQRDDGEDARDDLDDIAGIGLQPARQPQAAEEIRHVGAAQLVHQGEQHDAAALTQATDHGHDEVGQGDGGKGEVDRDNRRAPRS